MESRLTSACAEQHIVYSGHSVGSLPNAAQCKYMSNFEPCKQYTINIHRNVECQLFNVGLGTLHAPSVPHMLPASVHYSVVSGF